MAPHPLFGKRSGIVCMSVGIIILIAGIVGNFVLQDAKDEGLKNILKYEPDKGFEEDPNYVKCRWSIEEYFIYNLTNPMEFINNISKPAMEAVGPFTFNRTYCKYEVEVVDNLQHFREYEANLPVLIPNDKVNEQTRVFGMNGAYTAIMRKVARQSGQNNPEFVFGVNLLPNILGQVFSGLQSPLFINAVQYGRFPLTLLGVKETVKADPLVAQPAQAVAYYDRVSAILENYLPDSFFNDPLVPEGISNFTGMNMTFSNTSIQLILYGNPALGQLPGWLIDEYTGMGFGFLAQNATIVQTLYEIDETQYNALMAYVGIYLTSVTSSAIPAAKEKVFLNNWRLGLVNQDIDGDGILPDICLNVSISSPSGISLELTTDLWNPMNPMSFTNATGNQMWLGAMQNTTLLLQLGASLGLTPTQSGLVAGFLGGFVSRIVPWTLRTTYGITTLDKLAYAQWGVGDVLGGPSVQTQNPALPAPPEFAIYARNIPSSVRFNATVSEWLLTNNVTGLLVNPNNIFLLFSVASNNTLSNLYFRLSSLEATILAGYFQNMVTTFSDPLIRSLYPEFNCGYVVSKTALEWIWTGRDPLLDLVGIDDYVGFLDYPLFKNVTDTKPKDNETIYLGGSLDELRDFLEQKVYNYSTDLLLWKVPKKVDGLKGVGVGPQFKNDSFRVWIKYLRRSLGFLKSEEKVDRYGIELDRYNLEDSNFYSSSQDPSLDDYYQYKPGWVNVSSWESNDIYYGLPGWEMVEADIKDTVEGLTPVRTDKYFAIEPRSGVTMQYNVTLEITLGYSKLGRYGSGVTKGYIPLFSATLSDGINEKNAKKFKDTLALADTLMAVCLGVGVGLGGLLIIAGVVCFIVSRNRANNMI